MRKILIPVCLLLGSFMVYGQRSYQFQAENRLYVEGKELFSLKNYTGCEDKLNAFKEQSTDMSLVQEADYLLASVMFIQGKSNASEVLKEYLEKYPDTIHRDEISFYIGTTHFAKGEYEKAVYWFDQSNVDVLSSSQQEELSYRLAYSLLQTGDLTKARGYFLRIQEIGTTYKDASAYYVAYIDYASGRYSDALVGFTRMKKVAEYKEESQYFITQIYFVQAKYDKVVVEGNDLLSAYPNGSNNGEINRVLGNSYYHLGEQDKAIEKLSKYVSLSDAPLRGDLYVLGVCYFNKGNFSSAINAFGQTVRTSDLLAQSAYLYLGQSYLKQNDKNNARMAFESAASMSFDNQIKEIATYNYALLIHETSFTGFGESVTVFENFLNNYPNSKYADKVNDYLVEVYLTTKNYQAALASIDKIKRPSNRILQAKQDILFQLGTQAFANMQIDEAVGLFTRSIDLGTYNVESRNGAYFWRGESYYRLGEYKRAITDYRTYLNNTHQRNTDMYALAYYNMGYSNFKLHQYGEALSDFRKYIDNETNRGAASYADAHNRIGDCYFYNRQFALAEENYSHAMTLQPAAGDYSVFQKGYVQGLQKDYKGKISTMDRLIREYPQSQYVVDALFEKGRSYVLLDNNKMAIESFETLTTKFPNSSSARKAGVQLGLLYFNDNKSEKAAEAYKKVIDNYPGSEEARVALQDLKSVYLDLNDISSYATYVNSLGGAARFEVSEQDSLTYLAAERMFMRGDNDAARKSLLNYLQSFPQGSFSSNANYYLGSIAFAHKEYSEAKRLFANVEESGDVKFLEESVARKAEIEYLDKDYADALISFKKLQGIAESPENREAAKLGVVRCAQYTGKYQDALVGADELLKEPKLSPEIKNEAHYVRAKAYIGLKQEGKALADLKEVSKDTRTAYGAEAKYLLAQSYYNTKEDAKAEKELMNFIENGTPHQYWLARGFILLADVYIRKGDDFQARQYLSSLQNNYKGNDDIADMIENRLGKLKK